MKTSKNYSPCSNKDNEELIKVRTETKRSKVNVWKLSREINRDENPRGEKPPLHSSHVHLASFLISLCGKRKIKASNGEWVLVGKEERPIKN